MKSDMTCDLNHLEYANYLAERELLNKSSVRNITSLTESADGEQIALQEAVDIQVYLQKIVANIQNVWNKFKNSVVKLEANGALKDYKTILSGNPVGDDITIEENAQIPNLEELNKLITLAPVAFYANKDYNSIDDFLRDGYNGYFNKLGDLSNPMDIANEKCFTVAKGQETIGYDHSNDSKFPTIAACYGYLNNYQKNVADIIQKDINNINNSTRVIANAVKTAKNVAKNQQTQQNNNQQQAQSQQQTQAAAQTGAPANNGQQQTANASFEYNSSYGVLLTERPHPIQAIKNKFGNSKSSTSAPKQSAVKNNTSNDSTQKKTVSKEDIKNAIQNKVNQAKQNYENKQQQEDPQKKLRENTVIFMKGLTKVLSIKFAESNKARASCLKFCVQYAKAIKDAAKENENNNGANNGTDNGNNNQQQQDNNANVEVPQIK